MKRSQVPRRNWPRVPVPPEMFDLLIVLAKSQGYNEKTLYVFLYKSLKSSHPIDVNKLASILTTEWIDEDSPVE